MPDPHFIGGVRGGGTFLYAINPYSIISTHAVPDGFVIENPYYMLLLSLGCYLSRKYIKRITFLRTCVDVLENCPLGLLLCNFWWVCEVLCDQHEPFVRMNNTSIQRSVVMETHLR